MYNSIIGRMGCGSSSQLIPVNDTQQTDTQQCVIIPTNANNELKHSETDISTLSSIEEDMLNRVTVSQGSTGFLNIWSFVEENSYNFVHLKFDKPS